VTLIDATTTVAANPAGPDETEPGRAARITARSWDRIGLAILLLATAAMYLWDITINGMGNQFYAGAAQAGSTNWEALLFGSLDTQNFITVDKPPVSQWVMGLSGQIFGFSSASMLIPEALMGVAAVALLYAAVARITTRRTGLLAGAALALTPAAALMFRFNNPDAVMMLLMMAASYCTVRAMQRASAKWLVLAGVALGFAFLAKMLEGLMVMPAIGLAYLVVAPTPLRRRMLHLLASLVAFVVSAGWFVVVTLLWPASSRPYIAGSTDNSFMNLVLGYNGFSRVLGRNHFDFERPGPQIGSAISQMGNNHGGFGNQTPGIPRLFSGEFGFEIGWLLPAALLAVVLVLISRGRAPRTDLVRGGVILFGGWIVVAGCCGHVRNRHTRDVAQADQVARPDRARRDAVEHRRLELVASAAKRRVAARAAMDDLGVGRGGDGRAGGGTGQVPRTLRGRRADRSDRRGARRIRRVRDRHDRATAQRRRSFSRAGWRAKQGLRPAGRQSAARRDAFADAHRLVGGDRPFVGCRRPRAADEHSRHGHRRFLE
jgi:4-amino-4-deoxy-L-arabinose transferase-like glycosyltransferase